MTTTLIGEPDDMDREFEVAQGIADIESYLGGVERIKDVGSGVIAIEQGRLPVDIGRVARSSFLTIQRQQPRQTYPGSGVYRFLS